MEKKVILYFFSASNSNVQIKISAGWKQVFSQNGITVKCNEELQLTHIHSDGYWEIPANYDRTLANIGTKYAPPIYVQTFCSALKAAPIRINSTGDIIFTPTSLFKNNINFDIVFRYTI